MKYDFDSGMFTHVTERLHEPALVHPDGTLSWRAMQARTRMWMQRARAAGARPDYPMLIIGHKEASFVYAMLGCLNLGVPYVPVDAINPVERIRQIVDIAHTSVIYDAAANRFIQGHVDAIPLKQKDVAYIMFTSGSTGVPKGVQIGRESITLFARWIRQNLNLGPTPVLMDQMLFSFDFSLFNFAAALSSGGTCVLCPREITSDRDAFLHHLAKHRVTVWASTPSFIRQQLINPDFDHIKLPDLRVFVVGAESLSQSLVSELRLRFPDVRIINSYGPTEATCSTTWVEIDDTMLDPVTRNYPIGRAKPYAEVFLDQGELCISGDHVMRGYLNRDDLNETKLFNHHGKRAFRSGDMATMDERGLIHFRGRRDDQIKLNGIRIELAEIDAALSSLPGVRTGVATTLHRADGSLLRMVGVVEPVDAMPGEGFQPLPERLLDWRKSLALTLPPYMMPSELIACSPLPTTTTDKTDRRKLEAMYFQARRSVVQDS
ncbi:MAG: D-alanine--poly(phosphoribitol) ligase [Comamonadaceae bacterium]|nr:MAG: D-alanine--poly(phosphoribitol) ligase [Comamonadaceae bacterium]